MKKIAIASAVIAVAGLLQGCASPGHAIDNADQARAVAAKPAAPAPQDFPAIDSAKWKQGAFANAANLRALRAGMGKDQVRNLLGHPHFSEGLWGVREWNYIFHFRTGAGADAAYRTCQYMVRFDRNNLSTGGWWKDPSCAALIEAPAGATAAMQGMPAVISADALFRFDRSDASDLLPGGRARIAELAQQLRRGEGASEIRVTGHTDRLGDVETNDALSLRRAETVRQMLVQSGVPATKVRALGVGSREPVSRDCRGDRSSPELIACLAPDRRVEIDATPAAM